MDDVVRESRVLGLRLEERQQDLGRRLLAREREVGGVRVRDHHAGVEDRGLGVVRVRIDDGRERFLVGAHAIEESHGLVVAVERGDGLDVALLAWRSPARQGLGARDRGVGLGDVLRGRRHSRHRIPPERHRRPPVRHRAARIRGRGCREVLVRALEPERVELRHAAVEPLLGRLVARRREMDGPNPFLAFGMRVLALLLRAERARGEEEKRNRGDEKPA